MITPYTSQQPVDDFGLLFASLKYSASLAATTDTTLTVPSKAQRYKAVIKVESNGLVWVALNATAAVPAGSIRSDPVQLEAGSIRQLSQMLLE